MYLADGYYMRGLDNLEITVQMPQEENWNSYTNEMCSSQQMLQNCQIKKTRKHANEDVEEDDKEEDNDDNDDNNNDDNDSLFLDQDNHLLFF